MRTQTGGVPLSRAAALVRCLIALAFVAAILGAGIGAALTAWSSPALPFFEACCLLPLVAVPMLELRPAVLALRPRWRVIHRFRCQLDALPETPHPLGA